MPYMLCPISAIETFDSLEEAKEQALTLTKKLGPDSGGFAVFSVTEIGHYEHVSPIWNEPRDAHDRGQVSHFRQDNR